MTTTNRHTKQSTHGSFFRGSIVTIIRMTIYKLKLKAQLVYYRNITVLLSRASCFEALAAIYRSVAGRLKCELSLSAALATSSDEVLTLALFSILFLIAASLAALGLIEEALFSVESLFAGCEYELLSAISAGQGNIFVNNLFHAFNFYFIFNHCSLPRFVMCKLKPVLRFYSNGIYINSH